MQGLWLDLKSAMRQMRGAPGTATAAVLTLAIGIGTTAAVFTFLAAVMSAASPVDDMTRRVALWSHNRNETETKNAVSVGDFIEWRRRATLLDRLVAIRGGAASVGGLDQPVRVSVSEVTTDYVAFFRWSPMLGRTFVPADGTLGAPAVAVLSYDFWKNSLASRTNVIGSALRLDGVATTVIGVLPRMPAVEGVFVPLVLERSAGDHGGRSLFVWARLRDGISIEQARAEMIAIGQALETELPQTNRGWTVNTRPLQEEFIGPQARLAFAILAGTVMSVLLIGCVNIANLLMARGLARRGELAVRTALGAGGWRIARQLLAECAVLAVAGAIFSLAVSRWTLDIFLRTFPIDSPWVDGGVTNVRALALTAAAAILATVTSGLAPILAVRKTDLVSSLQASGRAGVRQTRRLTSVLVGAEVGLAVLLLVVSGLLMRTLAAIERLEPGFDVENVLTASVTLPESTDQASAARWFDQALARVRTMPAVRSAGATSRLPFVGSRFNANRGLEIEGRAVTSDQGTWAVDYTITPQLLETLRVRLTEGRAISDADGREAPLVALVNHAMAKRFWPDRSPLGARLRQGNEASGQWRTVIGVVADIRNDDADQPAIPYLYIPLAQQPQKSMTFAIKTATDPAALAPTLRSTLATFDPDQALYDVRTMQSVVDGDLEGSRVLMQVLAAFALIALGLAGLGVWGVASQAVGQRTREIGVRVALGATSPQVARLMAAQGLTPMLAGLAIGLAAGLTVGRVMRSVLFETSAADPIAIAGAMSLLLAVCLIATVIPALRAARLDPVVALRN